MHGADARRLTRIVLALGLVGCGRSAQPPLTPEGAHLAAGERQTVVHPPSALLTEADAMPALRPASLEAPRAPEEILTETRGTGGIRVEIVSRSSIPVFVKIRDTAGQVVAQVHVTATEPGEVNLDGGAYQMFVRVVLDGRVRYLQGAPFDLPPGMRGSVPLAFEIQTSLGMGSGLQDIPADQF